MGRKPVGEKAMSAAERQQRRRDKLKAGLPLPGNVLAFRHELWRFVYSKLLFEYSGLDSRDVEKSLELLGLAIRMDFYIQTDPANAQYKDQHWVEGYLMGFDNDFTDNIKASLQRDAPRPAPKDIYQHIWNEPPEPMPSTEAH